MGGGRLREGVRVYGNGNILILDLTHTFHDDAWVKGLLYTDEASKRCNCSNFTSKKYKLVQFLPISILNSPQK